MRISKRIVSFFLAFVITLSCSVSSFAVETDTADRLISSNMTFFDWLFDLCVDRLTGTSTADDLTSFMSELICVALDSDYCPDSDDHKHEWFVVLGVARCEHCGAFGTITEEILEESYSTYISTLPSTTVSSSTVSSADTCLYNGAEVPDINTVWTNKETYPYAYLVRVDAKDGEDEIHLYFLHLSDTKGYRNSLVDAWIIPAGSKVVIYSLLDGTSQYEFVSSDNSTEIFTPLYYPEDIVGEGNEWRCVWCNADICDKDDTATVYLAASDPVPVSSSSTSSTNDRFGLFMEELDEWNNTYGYDANEYAANYFISPDDGDSLYSPAVFSESTMTFTEPTTGMQYLCTDWLYYYDPDLSVWFSGDASFHEQYGMYLLEIADSSYYVDSTAVDVVGIMYVDDFIRIGTFARVFSSDGSYTYTMLSYQDYSCVMVSQTECGLNGHTYTYETVTEATCSTSGERKYTCSVCGDEYAEYIPATGNHTYKSSVTQEATCAASGVMTYTCSTCGTEYTETIAPTGVHSYEYSVAVDPTCTADGTGLYTCFVCGDQYTETLPATGHSGTLIEYVSPEYDENGNLTVAGYSVYECTICGAQYTVSDEVTAEKEGFFSWLWNQFSKLIESIFDGLASGIKYLLENIIGAITDWIIRIVNWVFDLFDGDALSSFFGWFSDDNEILNADFGVSSSTEVDVWAYS